MTIRRSKLALALVLALVILGAASNLGFNRILPSVVPVKAIQCPTGGVTTNGCLTVSLDVHSFTQPVHSATCDIIAGQLGVCDTTTTVAAQNVTTFRVGATLNST